jgi:hypothetical protein
MLQNISDNPDLDLLKAQLAQNAAGNNQDSDPNNPDPNAVPNDPTNSDPNNPNPNPQPETKIINDEDEERYLLDICRKAEEEDLDIRYPMLVRAKRNELYFNNIQKLVYDETARDYRTIDDVVREFENLPGAGDIKTNNIYRAFAESLIAALSVQPPTVQFIPDDAEDPDDIETADAYTHIAELIDRHNHAQLMLIKGLTILFNQGIIFGYNFTRSSADYGTITSYAGTKQREVPVVDIRCPQCAELLDSDVPVNQYNPQAPYQCYNCGYNGPTQGYKKLINIDEPIYEETPKSRSLYELYGCTAVKIPIYAKKQSDVGYVILRVDDNLAKFKAIYDKNGDVGISAEGGDTTKYERWARIPLAYSGAIPNHMTTARFIWLRPWYFYILDDAEVAQELVSKYPGGLMVTLIGDKIVDKSHEKLDDCWTITFDPRSNFIHGEPAGNALIPMQDAENDMFNLGLQSIEYGIPETFAHPKTVNFEAYSKSPTAPGMLTKAMPPGPDKNIADGFHTLKTATLTNEYTSFSQSLTQKTQFTVGAFPSIFGGEQGKANATATEYTESRAHALQRLQLVWAMISVFWTDLTFKGVKKFAENMEQDEQYSKKEKGTFVNVFIQKSALSGRVGHVESEINTQLPISWSAKKDFIMSLIQLNNPVIGTILLHPNNSELLKYVSGIEEIYIPGENDRNKQFGEFYELAQGQPVGPGNPSIPIDLEVDDHAVHMQVLKNILVSPVGIQLYKTNPTGYQNNVFHYLAHEKALQAKTIAPAGNTGPGQPPNSATNTTEG